MHVKNTEAEDCLNYKSICHENYKVAVPKNLLHRGDNFTLTGMCSTFKQNRKKLLTDNNFPMQIVDKPIEKFPDNKTSSNTNLHTSDSMGFLFENQMPTKLK